jgi:hypothetical protein
MARTTGNFEFANNFEVLKAAPLDARLVVGKFSDLADIPLAFKGMVVSITNDGADNGLWTLEGSDPSVAANWTKIVPVPAGGTSGQVLAKNTDSDYDVEWVDPTGGTSGTTELEDEVTANIDVGSVKAGETIPAGTTFLEFAKKILIEVYNPEITEPSTIVRFDAINPLVVAGETQTVQLNLGADRGVISNTWPTASSSDQGPYAGPLTEVNVTKSGTTIEFTDTANSGTEGEPETFTNKTYPDQPVIGPYIENNYEVSEGINEWVVEVVFDDGTDTTFDPTYVDSAGDEAGSFPDGGSKAVTKSIAIEGVYPIQKHDSNGNNVRRELVSHDANNIKVSQPFTETNSVRHLIGIPTAMIPGNDPSNVEIRNWDATSNSYKAPVQSEWQSLPPQQAGIPGTDDGSGNLLTAEYIIFEKKSGQPLSGGDTGGQAKYEVYFYNK